MPIVKRVHFVCRDNENVIEWASGQFVSGYWRLGADVALAVEEVYLHESKDTPSYRQGKVVGRRLEPFKEGMRYVFICEPSEESRDWEGQSAGERGYGY